MWTCTLCEKKNGDDVILCQCGFDRSLDYGKFSTIAQLEPDKIRKYEQKIVKNPLENAWIQWAKSVQAEIGALDSQIGQKLISKMQEYYKTAYQDAIVEKVRNAKSVKTTPDIPKDVIKQNNFKTTTGYFGMDQIEKQHELEYHLKHVKYKGTLMDTFVIGNRTCEGVTQSYVKMSEGKRWNYEGNCWYFAVGKSQSYERAVECYRKATTFGDVNAWNNLGNCYYYGSGVAVNHEMAIECYRKAAEKMNPAATYNLAYCYLTGTGTKKNRELANTLYERAEVYHKVQQKNNGKVTER